MVFGEQLDHISDYVEQNITPLNEEQLNWKLTPSKWSIAQCLDHIIITNTKYFGVFDSLLNGGYHPTLWQRISPLSNWWGRQLLKWTDSIPHKKITTPSVLAPSENLADTDIVPLFLHNQEQLIKYLEQLNSVSKQTEIIISSPVSSVITLRLRTAMRAIVQHQQRHINQANNILHHSQFPRY